MRIYLAGALLLGMLSAGCSSDPDPAIAGNTDQATQASAATMPTTALASRRGAKNFASLPDRGELLRYSTVRKVERKGAYTSHPVDISEAHALNAIASGHLRMNGPDGKPIDVRFDRIEEHPDGNWTWVGQNDTGEHAVLTFGERAVFGEIFAGGRSLRVNTINGSSWVVETNQALLAGTNRGQRQGGPDFLVPPAAGGGIDAGRAMAGSRATAVQSGQAKAASSVVDVLLGYTNGLATQYGGASAATSLVTSLVAQTNAAYQRSGVNMRIRLVSTLQVNYADNSDNADVLQQLTGYNADTGQPITPNAAFTALRAAREEFGADLVSLVRQHRSPEQNGCGIAWLLGAEQSGISASDEAFGYSVVSYGQDVDEGDGFTYFCSDYSLAHEFGHNMGQAHNTDDSEYAGVHAYSYGYREASSTGFYTIMAYPQQDGSQFEIPNFANPAVNYSGRPTGVANASDNVRSLNLTMPIVSEFRDIVVPLSGVKNDFNNDGVSDILWRNTSTGQNLIWRSGDSGTQQAVATVGSQAWKVVGAGDFDGDGTQDDILWRNTSTGANAIWLSANNATQKTIADVTALAWTVVGVGDFNGDGVSDILWRNTTSGQNTIWLSGSNASQRAVATVTSQAWIVAGVGDFNNDGIADILWRNTSTGANSIWRSANNATQTTVSSASVAWKVQAVGDFNGDGSDDIFWRNTSNGQNLVWRSGNSGTQQSVATVSNQTWQVAGAADFNGDGISDLLWRNRSTAANAIWLGANNATQKTISAAGPAWSPVGF